MNISLRKAKALQISIVETINNIDVVNAITINQFQDWQAQLAEANANLIKNDARKQKLLMALFNIRALVGTANASCDISLLLAQTAFIDKRIIQLELLSSAAVKLDSDVINGKLARLRSRAGDERTSLYGFEDGVKTGVLSQEQIDTAKVEISNLKKKKQQMNDQILELNIKTDILLSEDSVNALTEEHIL
jgi:hypothetical protein